MTTNEFAKRSERSEIEPLVFSRTEEGIKVYSARDPKKSYLVSGSPEAPSCTCPDFQCHGSDPQWRCKHILLASSQLYRWYVEREQSDAGEDEERKAIQEEGTTGDHAPAEKAPSAEPVAVNGSSQMLIKRSVSPDGRIDSLSVEFACPVEKVPVKDIKERAIKTLQLQSDIVETFLNGRKNGNGKDTHAVPDAEGAIPATLVSVGGMDGKFGRRLFISVQANGDNLRLFGNKKQLGEHLTAVGCAQLAGRIAEGLQINANCRILTRPSQNGKYTDITQVLPVERRER